MILPDFSEFQKELNEGKLLEIAKDMEALNTSDEIYPLLTRNAILTIQILKAYHEFLLKHFEQKTQD